MNGKKKHIVNLLELMKYAGQEIIKEFHRFARRHFY
jgi:hypothetical protein